MRARRVVQSALVLLAAVAPVAAWAATRSVSPGEAVAKLNALRAANHIPGRVVEVPGWSHGCKLHNAYQIRNNTYGHLEAKGKPGYTAAGDEAARTSLFVEGVTTWTGLGPWGIYPYHEFRLLAPQLTRTGFDNTGNVMCMTVLGKGGWRETTGKQNLLYTFPGNGARGVPTSANGANESPLTPASDVGLAHGATTGFDLFVYADGPWARCGISWCPTVRIVSASLAPAARPKAKVAVRWTTRSQYPYPSQIVVPLRPLTSATTYRATVTMRSNGISKTVSWTFTTV